MSSKLENLLLKLGEPGKLQVIGAISVVFSFLHAVTMNFIMSFITMTPRHHCKFLVEWLWPYNVSIPGRSTADGNIILDSCHHYLDPYNHSAGLTTCTNGYVYDHPDGYDRISMSSEFGLVCDLKYLVRVYQLCYFAGVISGGMVGGVLCDIFGRRCVGIAADLLFLAMGVCTYMCSNLFIANVLVYFHGVAMQTKLVACHTLVMETFPGKYRMVVGVVVLTGPAFGFAYAALLAYYFVDWRIQILCHALLTMPALGGFWFVPESIRWLLTNQRTEDALAACKAFARFNGIVLPSSIKREISDVADDIHSRMCSGKRQTILDLFRYGALCRYTFVLCFAQFTAQVCLYGFSFLVTELGGNIYVNSVIISVLDGSLRFLSYYFVKCWGRKKVTVLTLIVLGIANVIFVGIRLFGRVSPLLKTITIVVGMTGRVINGVYFCSFFILLSEVFPTTIRSTAQGFVSAAGRAGLMATPLMLFLSDYIWKELPFTIFASLGITAGISCIYLPETKDMPLPNTIEEAVRLSKKVKDVDCKEVELKVQLKN